MYFNPRSPSGLRLHGSPVQPVHKNNFNPRSPSGLRQKTTSMPFLLPTFQSTQPEWAATLLCIGIYPLRRFQSTQPEWAATLGQQTVSDPDGNISIHAARVGCDGNMGDSKEEVLKFQSTQPEWAATSKSGLTRSTCSIFQSTQPEWAATAEHFLWVMTNIFQSTQPEWAATPLPKSTSRKWHFNPRSPSGLRLCSF